MTELPSLSSSCSSWHQSHWERLISNAWEELRQVGAGSGGMRGAGGSKRGAGGSRTAEQRSDEATQGPSAKSQALAKGWC